ncbi:MAG: hypothetical protein GWO24_30370, partial [Akkermansiaceae bacterium]|nr:hypothetical protein [Akkermansiaceae bacterium]
SQQPEEGWPNVNDVLSFEIDTWMVGDSEVGPAIGLNRLGFAGSSDHPSTLARLNGDIFRDGETVSGTATISWTPTEGASFTTTGLITNANFTNIPTPDFTGDDFFTFALAARTGGANEDLFIDNLVICVGRPDSDGDGLSDGWEEANGLDPNDATEENGADGDPDGDGVSNIDEQTNGSDPQSDDTDGDGLKDGVETNTGTYVSATDTGTDPALADTDGDGLDDNVEDNTGNFVDDSQTGTDPNNPNSDGDSLNDGAEVAQHPDRDPNTPDDGGIYRQDFELDDGTTDLQDGSFLATNGAFTPVVQDGALVLTNNATGNTLTAYHIPGLVGSSTGFIAQFEYSIMDNSGNPPADGFAFSYGALPEGAPGNGESGFNGSNSLSFQVDTWNNAGDNGIRIEENDVNIAFNGGLPLADGSPAVPTMIEGTVYIEVKADGTVTFTTTGANVNAD